VPLLFAATLFVSAFLLFLVQPMIAQMILPLLGGTPAVWNTCMVFFQAALLAGYAYTHSATTYMPVKRQTLVQGLLLILPFALFMLPFSIGEWTPTTEANPIWSVLYILLIVVGVPFFVVATSAPLLQRWFSSTGHPSSKDPYFLYGASNLGSMLALLCYPFVFQRTFELPEMARVWMIVYGLLILLVGACALVVWRAPLAAALPASLPTAESLPPPKPLPVAQAQQSVTRRPLRQRAKAPMVVTVPPITKDQDSELTWLRRLRWIGLAAAPSSLMLGVTTYMTTDIAAIPLLWIIPLTLYLLSFILVFARWPVLWTGTPHRIFVYLQPLALLTLGMIAFGAWAMTTLWTIVAHLGAFFACVMVCHGELAKDRPPPKHLTEFYLWMSVGGVLGGIFNCLIAPLVFKQIIEYFLVLIVVLFLRPQTHFWSWIRRKPEPADDHSLEEYLLDIGYAACLGLLAYALLRLSLSQTFWRPAHDTSENYDLARYLWDKFETVAGMTRRNAYSWARWTELLVIEGVPAAICLSFAGRPLRIGPAVVGLFLVNYFMLYSGETDYIYQNRTFFSVQRIRQDVSKLGTYNVLIHGGIDHGRQNVDPALRDQPISYFFPTNPVGQVFTQLKQMESNPPFAVVGLGTGTLASYANKGQTAHFYEIDPAVLHLSEPLEGGKTYFWYLHDAKKRGVDLDVKLGDGRLKIKDAPANYYQVIVLDAFSSDAIPAHLLTKQAIALYLTKLKEDGILVFNITNRYIRLAPVLADAAKELDLICLEQSDGYDARVPDKFSSDWAILFRKRKDTKQMSLDALTAISAPEPGMISSLPWAGMVAAPSLDFPSGLPQLLDPRRWERVEPTGRPAWTDTYQDLISVMNW
jgi:hypothetical protein